MIHEEGIPALAFKVPAPSAHPDARNDGKCIILYLILYYIIYYIILYIYIENTSKWTLKVETGTVSRPRILAVKA